MNVTVSPYTGARNVVYTLQFGNKQVTVTSATPAVLQTTQVHLGLKGDRGDAGADADKYYKHDQMTAADVWVINHNLNKYPSATVLDSGGSNVEGHVKYPSINQITLTFSAAFAGVAYLN